MMLNHNKGLKQQGGAVQALFLIKAVVTIVLVAWIAHSSLQLARMLTSEPEIPVSTPLSSSATPSANQNTAPTVDINALKTLPLFGEIVPVVAETIDHEAVEAEEEVLVETQLNLVLKGLFTSANDQDGRAIVANGRKEHLYQIGEKIEGLSNVKLLAVFTDRIKLDNRGNAEVLYLYPDGEKSTTTPPSRSPALNRQRTRISNDDDDDDEGLVFDNDGENTKKLNEIIRVVRERDKTTGNMLGFRVLPGRDRESFNRSGLKVNDVITSIDGDALTDLRTAMTIYRNKREATQVSLLISRDGSEISLDIDLAELSI